MHSVVLSSLDFSKQEIAAAMLLYWYQAHVLACRSNLGVSWRHSMQVRSLLQYQVLLPLDFHYRVILPLNHQIDCGRAVLIIIWEHTQVVIWLLGCLHCSQIWHLRVRLSLKRRLRLMIIIEIIHDLFMAFVSELWVVMIAWYSLCSFLRPVE